MKKVISALLSIMLIMSIIPFSVFATDDFDISDYTWEDIMSMSSSEFRELLSDFERVYDPFDTYETDPIMGSQETQNDGGIQLYWSSGNMKMTETGSHELITARACGVLLNDKGFWGGNQGGSILIALTLSLASILPDRRQIPLRDTAFAGHFYDPDTLATWSGDTVFTARTNTKYFFDKAKEVYSPNQLGDNFIEYAGRMLHYIQDASEPHHAANITAFQYNNAHGKFEDFADENLNSYIDNFTTITDSVYTFACLYSIGTLLHTTAQIAKSYAPKVINVSDQSQWSNVAGITTRTAVQYSAMALYKLSIELNIPLTK